MKAAVLQAPFRVELIDRTLPPLGAGQARMRIEQCGLCTSEIDLWIGKTPDKLPAAIGHEVAGIIEQTGPGVESLQVGDRVAVWMDGGGFAEAAVVEERHCVPVAPAVTFPAVAEPLACVINAVEAAAPALGDDVAIIGCGFMGTLVQLVTALKGPRSITVVDFRDDALERAAALGATRVVDAKTESPVDVVREATDGRGADVTYEATGANAGLELAGELTRMSGKICIVGYHQGGTRTIPLAHWNWMAFDIVNAHFRNIDTIMSGMHAGMRLVNAGVLDVRQLVTNVYPLERIDEALETAAAKPNGFLKAVVDLNEE
jgi:threonine dehydrogenase-like Zn-dependent dehydrogenase